MPGPQFEVDGRGECERAVGGYSAAFEFDESNDRDVGDDGPDGIQYDEFH